MYLSRAQAHGALGETEDNRDFSLHAWDRNRDLFTSKCGRIVENLAALGKKQTIKLGSLQHCKVF